MGGKRWRRSRGEEWHSVSWVLREGLISEGSSQLSLIFKCRLVFLKPPDWHPWRLVSSSGSSQCSSSQWTAWLASEGALVCLQKSCTARAGPQKGVGTLKLLNSFDWIGCCQINGYNICLTVPYVWVWSKQLYQDIYMYVCVDVCMCTRMFIYVHPQCARECVCVYLYTEASLPVPLSLGAFQCLWDDGGPLWCGELGTGNQRGTIDPFPQKNTKQFSVTMIFVHC